MLQLAKWLCRNTALLWIGILVQEGLWIPWWVGHESVQSLKAQQSCTLSHLDCQAERMASMGWAELQNSTTWLWFYIMLKARVDICCGMWTRLTGHHNQCPHPDMDWLNGVFSFGYSSAQKSSSGACAHLISISWSVLNGPFSNISD